MSRILPIWNFFRKPTDGSKTASCNYCHRDFSFRTSITNLKQHLKQKHNSVYNEFINLGKNTESAAPETKKEQQSDADSNDESRDQDNAYTEVVYLEQESLSDSITPKHKQKPKPSPKTVKKREFRLSSDDIPLKRQKTCENNEENGELDAFIKYVTCLLKKLPPNVFSEVQVEIINAIMKANMRVSQSAVLNKDLGNTSANIVTVNEITPGNVRANYIIKVAPTETETENSEALPS